MSKEEDLVKKLLQKLTAHGTPNGPSGGEAAIALHDLGATAASPNVKPDLKKGAELVITRVIHDQNKQYTSKELLDGAVKGAAALGTENAGIALSKAVHSQVPAATAREALKGMAALLARGKGVSGVGIEKMTTALVEATAHPSGEVRALAAEYLGTHGDAKHVKKLESLAAKDGEGYVRNSAKRAAEELRRRLP